MSEQYLDLQKVSVSTILLSTSQRFESLVALTDFCVLESQAIRMIKYDRAGNLNIAVSSPLTLNDAKLVFYRLDAGVIVGKSNTNLNDGATMSASPLLFTGTIDTNGGGFASIRSLCQKT